jgi:hypothetical protein
MKKDSIKKIFFIFYVPLKITVRTTEIEASSIDKNGEELKS